MVEEGDVVVVEWSNDGSDCFDCPVCGAQIFSPYGDLDTRCENCGTSLREVPAARIRRKGDRTPSEPEHIVEESQGEEA